MNLNPLSVFMKPIDKVLDRVITDKNARAEAKEAFRQMLYRGELDRDLAQIGVNKQEALHKSLWVAGWRPAVGWVLVITLLYNNVAAPILGTPAGDISHTMTMLGGMLGLAAARTAEKIKGVSREG